MVPVKLLRAGFSYSWLIPTADTDGDTVRCRWASATARVPNNVIADECAGICSTFPGAILNSSACISRLKGKLISTEPDHSIFHRLSVSYTATSAGFWAVSLMMEDYEFPWQTTPLYVRIHPSQDERPPWNIFFIRSVTPLQFLVQVYTSSSSCTVGNYPYDFIVILSTLGSAQVHPILEHVHRVPASVSISIRQSWSKPSSLSDAQE